MMNPKQTIACLAELRRLGFTDEDFWRVHHFREKDGHETMEALSFTVKRPIRFTTMVITSASMQNCKWY
jgi:hypothetical protein